MKVIHDFINCRSTFVRSGIISKVCQVRTNSPPKRNLKDLCYRAEAQLLHMTEEPTFSFLGSITKVIIDNLQITSISIESISA